MTDLTQYGGLTKGADWLTQYEAMLAAATAALQVLEGAAVTSSTSLAIGTGSKAFTTDQTVIHAVGAVVICYSAATPTNYVVGAVTVSSGTSLTVNVTLTGGSGTVTDWIIQAPLGGLSGFLVSTAGDLAATAGSVAARAADADLAAGVNRAFLDLSGSIARFGGTAGAGSAVQSGMYLGSSPVILTDAGSTNKAVYGATRFLNGVAWQVNDLGSYGSNISLSYTDINYIALTLSASIDIDFTALASHGYVKTIFIEQAAGAYTPTFKIAAATTNVRWLTTEPTWSGLAAGVIVKVVCEVDHDGYLYLRHDEDVRA